MIDCRRHIRCIFLSCLPLASAGCLFAVYPEVYDASDFQEFQYRIESDPPCVESPSTVSVGEDVISYGPVCGATITREGEAAYSLGLVVRNDYATNAQLVTSRVMTDSENDRMLRLFESLRINRDPRPFCVVPVLGQPSEDIVFFRWDDLELIILDCDRPRIDFEQSREIMRFLDGLVLAE